MGSFSSITRRGSRLKPPLTLSLFTLLLLSCATTIKVPVVQHMPARFMDVMKGGDRIGIIPVSSDQTPGTEYGEWSSTIQGAAENAFQEYGFFKIVDISSRKERLRELAHTHSGLTQEQKQIGQELTIDGLLYLEVPRAPVSHCRVDTRWEQKQECVEIRDKKCVRQVVRRYQVSTGVRDMTVFLKAKLVNLETGESLQYMHTKPYSLSSSTGNSQCPSRLEAFNKAAERAARDTAHHLSPKVKPLSVPVYTSPRGAPDPIQKDVKSHLTRGVKWLKGNPPDYEAAGEQWKEALSLSGNTSVSALWNLGVYYWQRGELERADKYFQQAVEAGGEKWLNRRIKKSLGFFRQEKKRREQKQ